MSALAWIHLAALAATAAWLASMLLPASNAVRIRNALLLRRGTRADFDWTPDRVPAGFRVERRPAPPSIAEAVGSAGIRDVEGDWPRALALVTLLLRNARDTGPILADLETTYRGIVAGGGYCADFVRVYLAAAHDAGLFCRQWAFSFDGFGGHGHTVVEVYDRQRARWAFLDVHNNVFAVRTGEDVPLAATEVREALLRAPGSLRFLRAGEGRLGYPHAHKLLDYYRRGAPQWYLWFGNDVVSRERHGAAALVAGWSGRAAHRLASAFAFLPPIVALVDPGSEPAVARMESLRSRFRIAAACFAALLVALAAQVVVRRG
jgi:hypothetical protein